MESAIEKIRRTRTPSDSICTKGLIWLTMLIEYDYENGKSTILRSYTRPAAESKIKGLTKKKQSKQAPIEIKSVNDSEELF